ncbi:uncharacterized protein LOC128332053 [Hemicordylus capensis]|uniref:uncharacterized protein LOC128332053 n=1 Tax=Hemicordylus capensis TaxID=884348 RepID=UPI0023025959|nr:uncharacterized protein LOC128332053 [Hemicordylus capensis]
MKWMMSRCRPDFSLLCVAVLLCLGSGAIDLHHLKTIVDYIRGYGVENNHYVMAVRLDDNICNAPTQADLKKALPKSIMDQMHKDIDKKNGTYVPKSIGNIVAARPRFLKNTTEHAEWRLLHEDQNSPVTKMLENKERKSCLIFFSKLSPCVDRCLNQNDMRNIVQWVNPLFDKLNQNLRAFVFETIYKKDSIKEDEVVVGAWEKIKDAPLFRCDKNQDCIKCFKNNQLDSNCLNK